MAQRIPRVVDGALHVPESSDGTGIPVGSPLWISWLKSPAARSFSFRGPDVNYTARKEPRARGGEYWVAYRKRAGELRKSYLGKAEDLTPDKLDAAAAALVGEGKPSGGRSVPGVTVGGIVSARDDAEIGTPMPDDHAGEHPYRGSRDDPLLTTKLSTPFVRSSLVPRRRLTERLQAALPETRLTLVSAPAGFGKTTLLGAWIGAFSRGRSAVWLSLDRGDNDPARFWRYFVAAVDRLQPGAGDIALALLGSPRAPPIEAVLTVLLNGLADLETDAALVLDDYHVIESREIHDALAFLIEHLPPRLRLVLSTRSDPPLPLAQLRARGEMAELRAADLRFTLEEAAAFLDRMTDLELSSGDVTALERHTEGWAAGLQLAALAMRDRADVSGFISAFAGSNRFVVDYLAEEVLECQPEHVQAFLLRTSILERMCAPLCDAVVSCERPETIPGSQAMLEHLEHANLFVIPLDDERGWYRYHHLFADVLRQRLRETGAGRLTELHHRASGWFEQRGLVHEAIGHALSAKDDERAAALIEQAASSAIGRGEYGTLLRWLDALPDEMVRSRPRLGLSAAWALTAGGRYEDSEARLKELESSAELSEFEGEISALRSSTFLLQDVPRSIAYARLALERLPEDDQFLRTVVTVNLGLGELLDGDLAVSERYSIEAAAIAERTGNRFVAVVANTDLGEVRERQGRLREATELFGRALGLATDRDGQPLPTGGAVLAGTHLSRVLYQLNDLDGADRYLTQAIRLGERGRTADVLWISYLGMARLSRTLGDMEAALGWRDRAERTARETNQPYGLALAAALRVSLQLAVGDDEAARRAREYAGVLGRADAAPSRLPLLIREIQHLTLARSLIFLGEPHRALPVLAETLRAAEATGRIGTGLEVYVLQAVALRKQRNTGEALAALEHALALGEPEGHVRVFVDEGAPVKDLLLRFFEARGRGRPGAKHRALLAYARRLLVSFEPSHPGAEALASRLTKTGPLLFDPLTARELEVLALISEGLPNGEISTRLFLATSTVKSYVNRIFRKLGVESRTQAVAEARRLRLVSE